MRIVWIFILFYRANRWVTHTHAHMHSYTHTSVFLFEEEEVHGHREVRDAGRGPSDKEVYIKLVSRHAAGTLQTGGGTSVAARFIGKADIQFVSTGHTHAIVYSTRRHPSVPAVRRSSTMRTSTRFTQPPAVEKSRRTCFHSRQLGATSRTTDAKCLVGHPRWAYVQWGISGSWADRTHRRHRKRTRRQVETFQFASGRAPRFDVMPNFVLSESNRDFARVKPP